MPIKESFTYRQLEFGCNPLISNVMMRADFGGGITFEWQPTERGRAGIIRQLQRAIKSMLALCASQGEHSINVSCGALIYSILHQAVYGVMADKHIVHSLYVLDRSFVCRLEGYFETCDGHCECWCRNGQ